MRFRTRKSTLGGAVEIPGSKSHTIRALFFATLADGESEIEKPLDSADARSAFAACRAFGADIVETGNGWSVRGTGGKLRAPEGEIDVGNSGTTIRLAIGVAALCGAGETVLTGDEQIQRRPAGYLAGALNELGARVECLGENGCPPVRVSGPIRGGRTSLRSPTSQFLTSLLICTPLAAGDTDIEVLELNERPYVDLTLWWLDGLGVKYERSGYEHFHIPGRQRYGSFKRRIPGDFSTATFFAVAAAVTRSELLLKGLDLGDTQGDRAVLDYLEQMGAGVEKSAGGVVVRGAALKGGEFDLNATPDALPAMAVAACFAEGETRLVNVPQARQKETDRISVMAAELSKMGADVEELADGLVVRGGSLEGAEVGGHGDHRVVMSLAVAGFASTGETVIDTAEAAAVTFPGFESSMRSIGADIEPVE